MKKAPVILLAILSAFVVASCPGGGETRRLPDWVTNPPEEDANYRYFMGSATDPGLNVSNADQEATRQLIAAIERYIGVEITTESTATARATLERFEADIVDAVSQRSEGIMTGFDIAERFVFETEDRVSVYVLGRYEKDALEAEQTRIRAIFAEREEAISGPERAGLDAMQSGEYFAAVTSFMEAALAASSSEVQNAAIKFERNINQAREAVERMNFIRLNNGLQAMLGQAFPEAFVLKVASGPTESSPGIPGVQVRLSYPRLATSGRTSMTSVTLTTDARGRIEFTPPPPDFVGAETVRARLDLASYLEALQAVPSEFRQMVAGLEDVINSRRVDFEFSVASAARSIPTGIVFIETDQNGRARATSDTANALMSALTQAGYTVQVLAITAQSLAGLTDAEIVERLESQFGDLVQRVAFGTATVRNAETRAGRIQASVGASLRVAELATGTILFSDDRVSAGMGANADSAIASAFRSLGADLGERIVNNLP